LCLRFVELLANIVHPNVEVRKPGSPPNIKESYKELLRKHPGNERLEKERLEREHPDSDQSSSDGIDF